MRSASDRLLSGPNTARVTQFSEIFVVYARFDLVITCILVIITFRGRAQYLRVMAWSNDCAIKCGNSSCGTAPCRVTLVMQLACVSDQSRLTPCQILDIMTDSTSQSVSMVCYERSGMAQQKDQASIPTCIFSSSIDRKCSIHSFK